MLIVTYYDNLLYGAGVWFRLFLFCSVFFSLFVSHCWLIHKYLYNGNVGEGKEISGMSSKKNAQNKYNNKRVEKEYEEEGCETKIGKKNKKDVVA